MVLKETHAHPLVSGVPDLETHSQVFVPTLSDWHFNPGPASPGAGRLG